MAAAKNQAQPRLSRQDVERWAVLHALSKELGEQLKAHAELLKLTLAPEETLEGFQFVAARGKIPNHTQKPDYRAKLVKAIGLERVMAYEKEIAALPVTPGNFEEAPLLAPKPRASATTAECIKSGEVRRALMKELFNVDVK